jgi:hypothetical protein
MKPTDEQIAEVRRHFDGQARKQSCGCPGCVDGIARAERMLALLADYERLRAFEETARGYQGIDYYADRCTAMDRALAALDTARTRGGKP